MQNLLAGVRRFHTEVYPSQREFFEQLARKKQKPQALVITCADSRINPNLITMTEPGDLFLLRVAGNIIPPHGPQGSGESATIEYSVEVLGIRHIIVMGHSQCGAIQALLTNQALDDLPAARAYFAHAEATKRIIRQKYSGSKLSPEQLTVVAAEVNVLVQLNNLSTHPCIAARLACGEIAVYGWYYDIAKGIVSQYDQSLEAFVQLDGLAQAAAPLPICRDREFV